MLSEPLNASRGVADEQEVERDGHDPRRPSHAKIELQLASGGWMDPTGREQTLKTYARRWLETRNLRPRTREGYEDQLRLRILPRLGVMPLGRSRRRRSAPGTPA